jgi:hypothetical protein
MRGASQHREGCAENGERVAAPPRQQPGLGKADAANRRHEDVQCESGRLDDLGAIAQETHDRDIARSPCLSDGGIERGDDPKEDREEEVLKL